MQKEAIAEAIANNNFDVKSDDLSKDPAVPISITQPGGPSIDYNNCFKVSITKDDDDNHTIHSIEYFGADNFKSKLDDTRKKSLIQNINRAAAAAAAAATPPNKVTIEILKTAYEKAMNDYLTNRQDRKVITVTKS